MSLLGAMAAPQTLAIAKCFVRPTTASKENGDLRFGPLKVSEPTLNGVYSISMVSPKCAQI